jgi:hypothetical protein
MQLVNRVEQSLHIPAVVSKYSDVLHAIELLQELPDVLKLVQRRQVVASLQ